MEDVDEDDLLRKMKDANRKICNAIFKEIKAYEDELEENENNQAKKKKTMVRGIPIRAELVLSVL